MRVPIEVWTDEDIIPGQVWDNEIKKSLENADVILLLVSNDFLVSNYVNDVEIKKALERYNKGEAIVIPIVLRPTQFTDFEIGKFQALPKLAKPISKWENRDEAWLNVSQGLKKVFNSISKHKINNDTNNNSIKNNTNNPFKFNQNKITGDGNITLQEINSQGDVNITIHPNSPIPQQDPSDTSSGDLSVLREAKSLIATGKTQKSIELLSEYTLLRNLKGEYNDIIMQSGRWSNLEREKRMGIRSVNEINIETNRINASLLSIISDLEMTFTKHAHT